MTEQTTMPEIRLQGYDNLWMEWITQQYGVPLSLIGRVTGMRTDRLYRMVKRWQLKGRMHVSRVDYGAPGPWRTSFFDAPDTAPQGPLWVYPTRETAWGMLEFDPGEWEPKAYTAAHLTAVAHLRYALGGLETDPDYWTSERLLRRRIAPDTHPHDAWMLDFEDFDKVWGIEVELSLKRGGARLVRSMRTALVSADRNDLAGVLYFVRGDALQRAVQRAAHTLAREQGLDQLPNLKIHDLDSVLVGKGVA
ncbi:Uncharacterised protein [Nocardia otitidiscaviarum]|uniref:Uncharacterized protein n=1 Tax=Nocardia otitidiscaviarum TaxID=1823 RepID=A0A378Y9Z8_9NOCA|nr:hypothetical protein [Nocardia otitidiscaviarum]SUA73668.1 Uncharacterised protein [Nocardia otitidiscaviarum]